MMDKVLSQEEINALFSAMSSDDLSLGGQQDRVSAPRKIADYDFHRADRISQDHIRSIHLLHEHFGRNFASSVSAYLRSFVDVTLASVEQISYSSFLKSLPDPTLFASIGMRPLDGNIALELNPSLVFPMIDMILGGSGCAVPENRNLTEIELNIIEGVVKLAIKDLQNAWRSITDLELFVDGKGTKAQMFQIVSPVETVIAVRFEMKTGEYSGGMNVCIPSRMLKQLRSKFDQQWSIRHQKSPDGEAERLVELIKPIPVRLTGEIRHSKLTVDDLLKVSVGDVIELNERVGDPVQLCVGGTAKFLGRIVQRRGKKSFEIAERCSA
jgi:flagellar motor switch protein FliM